MAHIPWPLSQSNLWNYKYTMIQFLIINDTWGYYGNNLFTQCNHGNRCLVFVLELIT